MSHALGPFDRPRLVLTSDQDWAPDWASERLLELATRWQAPLHMFRTNPSIPLDRAHGAGEITQGWHPNFASGSSHGTTPAAVIDYCQANFPGCDSVRSHGLLESSVIWEMLAAHGIEIDSQTVTRFQTHLVPMAHWAGILRLPVWFEDDVWLRVAVDPDDLRWLTTSLLEPGLKVINVHAALVATNCPSIRWYDEHRPQLYNSNSEPFGHSGLGLADVLERLVAAASGAGISFEPWDHVVFDARAMRAWYPI